MNTSFCYPFRTVVLFIFCSLLVLTAFSQGFTCADPIDLTNDLVVNGGFHFQVDNTDGNKFYKITAPQDGTLEMSSCLSGSYDTYLSVYDENCNLIKQNNNNCGYRAAYVVEAKAGETFIFEWDDRELNPNYPPSNPMKYRCDIFFHEPVEGTTCEDAISLKNGDNLVNNWFGDQYYVFVSPAAGRLEASTCGKNAYDTKMTLYDACDGNILTKDHYSGNCTDDPDGDNSQSFIQYELAENQKVVLKVHNLPLDHYDYHFRASFDIDENMRWTGDAWAPQAPMVDDVVVIEGNYNTEEHGELSCKTLWVASGATLLIHESNRVTIASNLVNHGTIHLENNASLIQEAEMPNNWGAGDYRLDREANNKIGTQRFWSSSVVNNTLGEAFSGEVGGWYAFDAVNQSFIAEDEQTLMLAGQGFQLEGSHDEETVVTRSFVSQAGFHSGDIEYPLVFQDDADDDNDWNLIGNPYPSGLAVGQFLEDNREKIGNAVYLWNAAQGSYAAMNELGMVNALTEEGATATHIPSGQGFFVQAVDEGNIEFKNSQREIQNNDFLRGLSESARIWFAVTSETGERDELLLGFTEDSEEGLDNLDATKRLGNDGLELYSLYESNKLAIQALPQTYERSIPIGLDIKAIQNYTFEISKLEQFPEEVHIYLIDQEAGKTIDLRDETYALELQEGTYEGRFELQLSTSKLTGLQSDIETQGFFLFSDNKQVFIQFDGMKSAYSDIHIYDLQGKTVFQQWNEAQLAVHVRLAKQGTYVVKVENAHGVFTHKVMVQ